MVQAKTAPGGGAALSRVSKVMREIVCPNWLCRIPAATAEIVLTFDDGPHPESTPRLLDTLSECGISATMFLTGVQCEKYASLAPEIERRGHAIANHGYVHRRMTWYGPKQIRESVLRTERAILDSGAHPTSQFRPPFGSVSPWMNRQLRELRYSGVLWSVMIPDWKTAPICRLEKSLYSGLSSGDIIVLHDRPQTISQVSILVRSLGEFVASRGWRFTSIPAAPEPQVVPA